MGQILNAVEHVGPAKIFNILKMNAISNDLNLNYHMSVATPEKMFVALHCCWHV